MSTSLIQQISKAIDHRHSLRDKHEAYRLCDGTGDLIPALYLDRFGSVALAHLIGDQNLINSIERELSEVAKEICEIVGCQSLYLRTHKQQAKQTAQSNAVLLSGPPVADLKITEHGIQYIVRPADQVNAGLFLDTRELRQSLLSTASGKKVLNLFAFTGSLGIAAWIGGAKSVTQVDIARGILRWAKENWLLNGGNDPAKAPMRFIEEDCCTFLDREVRRQQRGDIEKYDIILLDPPSFGSSKGLHFSIYRDLESLIERCLSLLAVAGELTVIANSRELSADNIATMINDGAKNLRIRIKIKSTLAPPSIDFTSSPKESLAMRGIVAKCIS